jgi:hypothetical protein
MQPEPVSARRRASRREWEDRMRLLLAALVACAASLGFADPRFAAQAPAPAPGQQAPAPAPKADPPEEERLPEIHYEDDVLPGPVRTMRDSLLRAARSGNLEELRAVLERNELMPIVSDGDVKDPIAYWKKVSADGTGRDVMAEMIKVLSSGFVRIDAGKRSEMYVWPYHVAYPLDRLSPEQQVELYLLVTPALKKDMEEAGEYLGYRAGIGPDGTLHFFIGGE